MRRCVAPLFFVERNGLCIVGVSAEPGCMHRRCCLRGPLCVWSLVPAIIHVRLFLLLLMLYVHFVHMLDVPGRLRCSIRPTLAGTIRSTFQQLATSLLLGRRFLPTCTFLCFCFRMPFIFFLCAPRVAKVYFWPSLLLAPCMLPPPHGKVSFALISSPSSSFT